VLPPSDFSTLKNFVRKPVHENCSKFFQWFKITNNQLTINDVICDVVFVNNNTATRTTESRRAGARNLMSSQPVFSLSVRSLRSMWWSRLACVFVTRNDSTLLIRALKWILRTLAVDDCTPLLPGGYVFQQDGAPAHTARATQNWL